MYKGWRLRTQVLRESAVLVMLNEIRTLLNKEKSAPQNYLKRQHRANLKGKIIALIAYINLHMKPQSKVSLKNYTKVPISASKHNSDLKLSTRTQKTNPSFLTETQ